MFQSVLAHTATSMPEVAAESEFETAIGTAMEHLFADAATGQQITSALVTSELTKAQQTMASGG